MNIKEALPVILKVLTNPYVIGTTVVILLYMDFCVFVTNYKKKPPKPKKKPSAPSPAPAPEKKEEGQEAQAEAAPQE